jgi:hypothetical protein
VARQSIYRECAAFGHEACNPVHAEDTMHAKKRASAATKTATTKALAKKSNAKKASAKKASAAKARAGRAKTAKTSARRPRAKTAAGTARKTTKVVAKKKTTARLAKATKSHVEAKRATKTARSATPGARRKAPIARRNAPRARDRAVHDASTMPTQEMEAAGAAEERMPDAAELHTSRDPLRGGDHDSANHSKPEVQLQRQHMRVLRGPERRPTMRGH